MTPQKILPILLGLGALGALPAEDCEGEPTPNPPFLEDCSDQSRTFFVWDLAVMPPATVEVTATCRLVGPSAYLYVTDDAWGTYVDGDMALRFMETMEFSAGAGAVDPTTGIIGNNRAAFGDFPDAIDGDPRIYLLLMDMADFVASDGDVFRFDGYFNSLDELEDDVVNRITQGFYRSNEVEMLYLNARIRPADDPYTLAVAAHEMQHLIHYNYDTEEELWMGEALAEVAMLVNGYYTDEPWVASYARTPSSPLVTGSASGSYGAYLLWGMYLYEQLGADFMIPLESQQRDGIEGLNRALAQAGFERDFDALFADWIVANAVADPTQGDGAFGYLFTDVLPPLTRSGALTGAGDRVDGSLLSYGAAYVDVEGSALAQEVEIESDGPLQVRFIRRGAEGDVAVSEPLAESSPLMVFALEPGEAGTFALASVDGEAVDTGVPVTFSLTLN